MDHHNNHAYQSGGRRVRTSASLIGQGDNQVILLRIPSLPRLLKLNLNEEQYVDRFVNKLVEMSELCGLPIEEEETWRSKNLFEYSREYYFKGSGVSSAIKRVSRLSSEANQTLPTLAGDLTSLYSTGASAASKDTHLQPAYWCTSIEAAYLIRKRYTWLKTMDDACTSACLLTSRYIGGLPVGLFASFCTRAVQDPFTASLRIIKTAATYPDLKEHLARWMTLELTRPDLETLIKDPQCIPIRTPLQAESVMRQEIKVGIQSVVKNKLIKELFTHKVEEEKANLIATLSQIRPVNPRLLNKLYTLSNMGIQEKYIGKYSDTRSIQKLAFRMWENESELLQWMNKIEDVNSEKYKNTKGDEPGLEKIRSCSCTTELAYDLRLTGWGQHLEGVTMPAQQEQSSLHPWSSTSASWKPRSILVQVDNDLNSLTPMAKEKRSPYFGFQTKLRARRAPLQVVEVGSMVSSLKQLMELKLWLHESPTLQPLIEELITEKTTMDTKTLEMFSRQIYAGTLSHRLDCPGLKRGGLYNQISTFSSHTVIVSDTASDYAKKSENHTICFQSVFLAGLSQLTQLAYAGVKVDGPWGLVISCSTCTRVIDKETFQLEVNKYTGVPLPISVSSLTPKVIAFRVHTASHGVLSLSDSYTVITARKFVMWEISVAHSDRITPLTNEVMISHFNLTEFQHLNCRLFFKCVIFFYFLFDETMYRDPTKIMEKILLHPSEKGAFDSLMDSALKCGLLRDLMKMTSGSSLSLRNQSHVALRTLLTDCLNKALENGTDDLIRSTSYLTQEDTANAYYRATCMLLRDNQDQVVAWLSVNHDQREINLLTPKICHDGESAVIHIRSLTANHNPVSPSLTAYSIERMSFTPHDSKAQYLSNPTLYQHKVYICLLVVSYIRNGLEEPLRSVVTLNDRGGEAYVGIHHMLGYLTGESYPCWNDSDPATTIMQVPLACTADECDINLDLQKWIEHLYQGPSKVEADLVVKFDGYY